MNTLKSKKHIWISLGLLLVITLVLGWFVGRYLPGAPRNPEPSIEAIQEAWIPRGDLTDIAIEEVREVPFGSTSHIEGMKHGDKYTMGKTRLISSYDAETKEVLVWAEETQIAPDPESETYSIEYPSFEVTVTDANVLSFDSFVDWYPDFEARFHMGGVVRPESKIVLVEARVENLSEAQVLELDESQLWSDQLVQMNPDHMGNGYAISREALRCINGLTLFSDVEEPYQDDSYLTSIDPEETRTVTLPYQVFEDAFFDTGNFDDFDLSQFSLELCDYESATAYRFRLG